MLHAEIQGLGLGTVQKHQTKCSLSTDGRSNFKIKMRSCCRISQLLFNDQKSFEVATLVQSTNFVAGEQGPEINVMPLMQMPQSRVNTFSVGAYDQESGRNNLAFAWASSVEMGGDSRCVLLPYAPMVLFNSCNQCS